MGKALKISLGIECYVKVSVYWLNLSSWKIMLVSRWEFRWCWKNNSSAGDVGALNPEAWEQWKLVVTWPDPAKRRWDWRGGESLEPLDGEVKALSKVWGSRGMEGWPKGKQGLKPKGLGGEGCWLSNSGSWSLAWKRQWVLRGPKGSWGRRQPSGNYKFGGALRT